VGGKAEILRKLSSIWTLGDVVHYGNHRKNIEMSYKIEIQLSTVVAKMASENFSVIVTATALNAALPRNCIVMKTDF